MMNVSLSANNIVKHYGGVVALSDGNLDVISGEVLALVGANGSGKSTLSKVINGVVVFDRGQLLLDDKPVRFSSPQAAKDLGISTVFQELSLIPQMSVSENIWLTREQLGPMGVVNQKVVSQKTEELLSLFEGSFKTRITPKDSILSLPPDEKQIIEILKAISFDPRILILDEATASLDSRQVQRLFQLVQEWKSQGKAIIFVSHRMEEIFQIADRYSVLRNGVTVGEGNINDVTENDLVRLMIDKDSVFGFKRHDNGESKATPVCLDVQDLHTNVLEGVSFQVHEGELLGIGGLQGQGQRDLLLTLFGDIPNTGKVEYMGNEVRFHHPREAIKKGIALVPGDRAKEGLLYIRSILENFMLPSWKKYGFPLKMKKSIKDALDVSKSLNLKMAGLQEPVSSLSGGNAQKVVIGKWLGRKPQMFLLDDPTKGVDVGTKAEFYALLSQLCDEGKTILFYSSDDEELIGLCDRVIILYEGKIRTELKGSDLTKENLVSASLGVTNGGAK
ncbi:MAG: sugar ABC transporter ATP-binding protein [Anaerolineaceae bacterium]|nr:sugar ABC transporter ATP-binding protein [Anaerolineaceae bacterium]